MKRAELYVGALWCALAMISGCTENPVKPTTGNLLASISDGARDANGIAGFYFRPPILPDIAYSGTFDATLSPEVVICEWANSCVTEIARYTMTTGTGGETIGVDVDDQQYHVNWQTTDFSLDPLKNYRILVNAGGLPLGFADVDVVNRSGDLRNISTNEYIPLLSGRTLPIKFRAETGIAGRIAIAPSPIFMEVGDAQGVVATIYDLHDAPVPDATPGWSIQSTSGAPANATFGSGTLTAVSPGNGTLTAAYRGRSASALYTIYEPPVSLAFATSCGSLAIGSSVTIIATAFDAAHQPITRTLRTHYSSSDDAIAVVDPSAGVVGGMGRGLATIGASLLGLSTVTRVLVFNSGDAITVAPTADPNATSLSLEPDDEANLAGSYSGVGITAETFGGCRSWSTEDDNIVSVTTDGHIKAVAAGTTTIHLTVGTLTGSFPVEVKLPPPPPPDEPPPSGPDCDATGCIVHPAACQTSRAMDVNVHGEMVIACKRLEGALHDRAFYWDGDVTHAPTELDESDAVHCTPYAINSHSDIVGTCIFPRGSTKTGAVFWQGPGGALQVLANITNPPLGTGGVPQLGTSARNINDNGVIVGSAPRSYAFAGNGALTWAGSGARWNSPTSTPVTFRWSSTWTGPGGVVWGISESGRMTGQSTVVQGYVCGFQCFNNADIAHAGLLPANAAAGAAVGDLGAASVPSTINVGLSQSLASAVNDNGVAVGWTESYVSSINNIRHLAERWPNGFALRTGIPGVPASTLVASEASDVNNAGWITGGWGAGTNTLAQAFIWKGDVAVPALVLARAPNSVSARANAVSQLFQGSDGQMQAYVAGQQSITTSSNLRAARWLVKQ